MPVKPSVWIVLDRQPDGDTSVRACRTPGRALVVAKEIIEEYRNHSEVEDEIDDILVMIERASAETPVLYGAGDASAVFYVSVEEVVLE